MLQLFRELHGMCAALACRTLLLRARPAPGAARLIAGNSMGHHAGCRVVLLVKEAGVNT